MVTDGWNKRTWTQIRLNTFRPDVIKGVCSANDIQVAKYAPRSPG